LPNTNTAADSSLLFFALSLPLPSFLGSLSSSDRFLKQRSRLI
jgi:hypothetical protein